VKHGVIAGALHDDVHAHGGLLDEQRVNRKRRVEQGGRTKAWPEICSAAAKDLEALESSRRNLTATLDESDSHEVLARHVMAEVSRALKEVGGEDRIAAQIGIANRLLRELRSLGLKQPIHWTMRKSRLAALNCWPFIAVPPRLGAPRHLSPRARS